MHKTPLLQGATQMFFISPPRLPSYRPASHSWFALDLHRTKASHTTINAKPTSRCRSPLTYVHCGFRYAQKLDGAQRHILHHPNLLYRLARLVQRRNLSSYCPRVTRGGLYAPRYLFGFQERMYPYTHSRVSVWRVRIHSGGCAQTTHRPTHSLVGLR